jgi:hypothetical protein
MTAGPAEPAGPAVMAAAAVRQATAADPNTCLTSLTNSDAIQASAACSPAAGRWWVG